METPIEHLTHTVAFSRKVSDGNYGSTEATIFRQFDTPRGASDEMIVESAEPILRVLRATVENELGIFPEASGEELIREAFPGAQVVEQQSVPAAASGPAIALPAEPPHDPYTKDRDRQDENQEWAKARLAAHPGEFWDNRADKESGKVKATYPDYKHKDTNVGIWLTPRA
jgi:hypothetical protein